MIKIETIRNSETVADEYLKLLTSQKNSYISPIQNLQEWLDNGTLTQTQAALVQAIINRFGEIVTSPPNRLREIADELGGPEDTDFSNDLVNSLRYKQFRRSNKAIWLISQFNLKSCPYCNAQYITSLRKNGKILCHFDHFYPKSRYPYFCLSFYNLIPCCSYCNQQKSSTNPLGRTTLHPFENSFAESFRFQATNEAISNFSLKGRTERTRNNIQIVPERQEAQADIDFYQNIFRIEELHNEHHDVIDEIYLKSLIYNPSYREELKKLYVIENQVLSEEELDRIIYGTYLDSSKINARPLTKMNQDLLQQFQQLRTEEYSISRK